MTRKIFVIEDDQSILELMELLIRKLNFEPVLVANAIESQEMITQDPPALILLDIMMAPMNGWELLAWLRNDKKTRDIPVILFTASPSVQERMAQMDDPHLGMLQKPVTFTEFKTEIGRFLS
ncbi:MAG: response regulator [Methanoregula sp.]|nr:response regulator [Methanoregula sp.]